MKDKKLILALNLLQTLLSSSIVTDEKEAISVIKIMLTIMEKGA